MTVNLGDISPPRLVIQDQQRLSKIDEELKDLFFTSETVARIRDVFVEEMERGIRSESSSLQMENTYIPELPDGSEEGKYLALDLGGTNFRVLLVEFSGGQIVDVEVEHFNMPDELRLGSGYDLFDFLAGCLCSFFQDHNLDGLSIPLGFTFSFPMAQHSLTTGCLVSWTKTFNCPDVVGLDAVHLLNAALRKLNSTVSVHAVLNDTTGTLLMGALLDKQTSIGLILGTGSNACYLEKADQVQHWEVERHGEKEVIIDIEWGAFGDNGVLDFIKTEFDVQVDNNSLLVKSFTFEKYIAGKYMGEIVRVVLVRLASQGLLFQQGGCSSEMLTSNTFTTSYVSQIEEDNLNGSTDKTKSVLSSLGVTSDDEDLAIVQHVCAVVSNRSALLVSVCLSALLDRMGKPEAAVAVDGSLFSKHPRFRGLMMKYISQLTTRKFKLLQVSDGSGKGAAVAVAIAMKLEQRFNNI